MLLLKETSCHICNFWLSSAKTHDYLTFDQLLFSSEEYLKLALSRVITKFYFHMKSELHFQITKKKITLRGGLIRKNKLHNYSQTWTNNYCFSFENACREMQPIACSSGVKDGEESVTLYYSISSSRCLNLSIMPRDSSVPKKTLSTHTAHYS